MGGLFAKWQPEYEAAGLAVFPVDGDAKRPAVTGYLNIGTRRSRELVKRFEGANALGFACGATGRGRRTAITVLDIDEPDENLLADALSRFGPSPIVVRTPSGKFHAWYRHNGERRMIRGVIPGRAVDILGDGFALAPPSQTAKGEYQFVHGGLSDVLSLPAMALPAAPHVASHPRPTPKSICVGERNKSVWRACMTEALGGLSLDELNSFAARFNSTFADPLPHAEVLRAAKSAWETTAKGENWFGTGKRLVLQHETIDRLLPLGSDATALMLQLWKEHWRRKSFVIANAMAATMPGGPWTIRRLALARTVLRDEGWLVELRPASRWYGPAEFCFGPKAQG